MKRIEYNKVHDALWGNLKTYGCGLLIAVAGLLYFYYIFGQPSFPGWAILGLLGTGWFGGAIDATRRSLINFNRAVRIDEVENSLRRR